MMRLIILQFKGSAEFKLGPVVPRHIVVQIKFQFDWHTSCACAP